MSYQRQYRIPCDAPSFQTCYAGDWVAQAPGVGVQPYSLVTVPQYSHLISVCPRTTGLVKALPQ
jgi:hypothetical protein